ncbi:YigZ family protein [Brucepastera parasyntrophica]|uniref:YigZ family protein n=1 Tax=Brucepastera parasyntrophica TaxID=2880008 RepID=UPI002109A20E|nr:YigZ family protein [Brucepastera parasyntrophica]ULQ59589.1 YigZ family protein [Brucepastera parasyntrophica]
MFIIRNPAEAEIEVKRSRFLAEIFPVKNQEEARLLLKSRKEKYRDAAHVVHAFVIGKAGEILGCSDDGEPSGTAGRPVLDVLKGSGITDILLMVTRWFGGILLGTGGLVKAYGLAARTVLLAADITELVPMCDFEVTLPYAVFDRVQLEIASRGIEITGEDFGTEIHLCGKIAVSRADDFCTFVHDITSGRSTVMLSEENRKERLT